MTDELTTKMQGFISKLNDRDSKLREKDKQIGTLIAENNKLREQLHLIPTKEERLQKIENNKTVGTTEGDNRLHRCLQQTTPQNNKTRGQSKQETK